jgi:hypothetical protein
MILDFLETWITQQLPDSKNHKFPKFLSFFPYISNVRVLGKKNWILFIFLQFFANKAFLHFKKVWSANEALFTSFFCWIFWVLDCWILIAWEVGVFWSDFLVISWEDFKNFKKAQKSSKAS